VRRGSANTEPEGQELRLDRLVHPEPGRKRSRKRTCITDNRNIYIARFAAQDHITHETTDDIHAFDGFNTC
jgi:hypothetical protein